MPIAVIDVGTSLNDPTADNMRQAFTKCNNNFAYLDGQFLSGFVTNAQVNSYFADPSNNGSFSPSTWRTELGVYSTAQVDAYFADPSTNGSFSASTWRGDLGLGTMATQNASAVAITGGTITGITDLAIADGGTGASTAPNARTNLGLGTIATQNANNVSITGGTISGVSGTGLSGVALLSADNAFAVPQSLLGVTDASDATAGDLGEFIEDADSVGVVGAGTLQNVLSIVLSAGDWDVSGQIYISGIGSTSIDAKAGMNTVSEVLPVDAYIQRYEEQASANFASICLATRRFNVSAPTTVYLVYDEAGGGMNIKGFMSARRVR